MTFMFRLQVYLSDKNDQNVLRPSTFMICLVLGEFCPVLTFALSQSSAIMKRPSFRTTLASFSAGTLNMAGLIGFILLNQAGGEASVLAPLVSLYIVFPVAFAACFMGEKLTFRKLFGILLGTGATILFGMSSDSSFSFTDPSTLAYYLLCVVAWGVCTPIFQIMGQGDEGEVAAGYSLNVTGYLLTGILSAFTVFWPDGQSLSEFDVRYGLVMMGGFFHGLANLFFILLSRTLPEEASVVAPLSSLYVLWPVILGMTILEESVTLFKILGIIFAVFGVLLMGINNFHQLWETIVGQRR